MTPHVFRSRRPDVVEDSLSDLKQQIQELNEKISFLSAKVSEKEHDFCEAIIDLRQEFNGQVEAIKMGMLWNAECHGDSHERNDQSSDNEVAPTPSEAEAKYREMYQMLEITSQERDFERTERFQEAEKFHHRFEDLERKLRESEKHNEELVTAFQKSEGICRKPTKRNADAMAQLGNAVDMRQPSEKKMREEEDEKSKSKEHAVMHRILVTEKGQQNGRQVNDGTLCNAFASLREQIQRIACFLSSTDDVKIELGKDSTEREHEFFRFWQDLNPAQRTNRTRAILFEMIVDTLLSLDMDDFDGPTEAELKKLEAALELTSLVGEAEIAEWRARSVRHISMLRLEGSIPEAIAITIRKFMSPIWPKTYDQVDLHDDKLFRLVMRLCKEAFDLTILLRSSKHTYQCEYPAARSKITKDSVAQLREPPRQGDDCVTDKHIVLSLSPALVKYSEGDPKRRRLLEPGHVVLFQGGR
ncbi:hypothetical protein PZA11_003287 [Diplocarpon coronariae]|uniref:Uncharacterized protein n=1 Tax=Diplocarpon coronariae TaxID=2795749 RepID=A0A218YZF6_9HELO|nr:hypothetical protein JHW43_003653 [Diplocarpon mali]OWP01048.1 hypothetical protein B2J93_6522 [Marssonina coronariae]